MLGELAEAEIELGGEGEMEAEPEMQNLLRFGLDRSAEMLEYSVSLYNIPYSVLSEFVVDWCCGCLARPKGGLSRKLSLKGISMYDTSTSS